MTKNLTFTKEFDRKLGFAYQQNLIEMFGYIYMAPNAHTKESLAEEFTKDGKSNERKILRMVDDVNTFCPYIRRNLNEIDGRTHYSISGRFSEQDLDMFYQKTGNVSVLYIFLEALLIRPLTTEEIMQKLNMNKKAADKIIDLILDASYIFDEFETETGRIIGNTKFFM